MLELSRFYGIVIRLHYEEKEHNPPHIHAKYGKEAASIDISTGEIISGTLPTKARVLVKEWVLIHSHEIEEIWETQQFHKNKPLE